MRRREFITLLGGAAATLPLVARADQGDRVRRVGVLIHGVQTAADWERLVAAFRQRLAELGWLEGRNVHISTIFSGNNFDRLSQIAQEIVALNPDVIFVNTTPATRALQQATVTIPIVFVQVSDPTGAGVIASLARPGGNITGMLLYEDSIAGKWLGMLREIAPRLRRCALVGNPKGFPYDYFLRTASAIAPSLGIEIVPAPVANAADIERSLQSLARVPDSGLLTPPDNTVEEHRDLIMRLAAQNRLPAVYSARDFVTSGGSCLTGPIFSINIVRQHSTSIASCEAQNRPIFRLRRRQNTKPSSISRPPGNWASRCRRPCWCAPTR
jgi:putative tryptophan/tyrosine transport system substrate-binding protein